MQDELELHGQWYIPQTEETFSGSLFIHKEKKQIYLHIVSVAKKGEFMAPMKALGHYDLIKGQINTGGSILLYDCNVGSPHNRIGQNTTAIVEVGTAFWNLDIKNVNELCFQEVDVDFGDIVEWSGMCSYEAEALGDKFIWNRKPEVRFDIHDNLRLRIVPYQGKISMWSFRKEYQLSQGVSMILEYQTDAAWEQIKLDIRTLNDLITLGMNRATYLEKLEYYHVSHKEEYISPDYVRPEDAFMGDCVEGKTIPVGRWEWLFSMQDLVAEDCRCLRNWYSKYEKLKPVVELYEAAHRFRGISVEMLFLNLVQALETYHARFICNSWNQYVTMVDDFLRETYSLKEGDDWDEHVSSYRKLLIAQDEKKSKSIHLKSRLGYLFLAEFKYVFEYLDYRMEQFIQLVLDTRNYYTHYAEKKEGRIFPTEKLPYVNSILMGTLQYYLLREIGIDDKKIEDVVGKHMESVMRSYDMFGKNEKLIIEFNS